MFVFSLNRKTLVAPAPKEPEYPPHCLEIPNAVQQKELEFFHFLKSGSVTFPLGSLGQVIMRLLQVSFPLL